MGRKARDGDGRVVFASATLGDGGGSGVTRCGGVRWRGMAMPELNLGRNEDRMMDWRGLSTIQTR